MKQTAYSYFASLLVGKLAERSLASWDEYELSKSYSSKLVSQKLLKKLGYGHLKSHTAIKKVLAEFKESRDE